MCVNGMVARQVGTVEEPVAQRNSMNICYCGAQAGYQHKDDCPFPLFRASSEVEEKWYRDQARLREGLRDFPSVQPSKGKE